MQGQCVLTRRLRGKSPSTHPSIGYDAPCPPRPCGRRGKIERRRARSHERNPRDRTKAIRPDAKRPTMRPPPPNRACGGTDGPAETRDPAAHGGRRRMKRYEIASSRELRSFCMVFVYGVYMPKSAISIPQKRGPRGPLHNYQRFSFLTNSNHFSNDASLIACSIRQASRSASSSDRPIALVRKVKSIS